MAGRLTARQRRFVEEYLVDRNGRAAAERAGYSARSARRVAYQLLHETPLVKAELEAAVRAQSERTGITADRVLREFAKIALRTAKGAFDEHGRVLPPHLLPDDLFASISSIESEEPSTRQVQLPLTDADGKPVALGRTVRIRFENKVAALDALARHFGLYRDGGSGCVDLERLKAAIERARAEAE